MSVKDVQAIAVDSAWIDAEAAARGCMSPVST